MDQEIVKEFLIESYEILNVLDNDLIALERESIDPELLNRIFRGVHTIKGTSGFLSFSKLVQVTHVGEGLLDRLRKGSLAPNEKITSALLKLIDAVREILNSIETTGEEGEADYSALVTMLEQLQEGEGAEEEISNDSASPQPQEESPVQDLSDMTAPEQTLHALQRLYAEQDGPVALEILTEERNLAESTIRNHITALNKEGEAVDMIGGNTYVPVAGPQEENLPAAPSAPAAASSPPPEEEDFSREENHEPAIPPAGKDVAASPALVDNNIRVDVELLDKLMNLVGELVLTRNQILQFASAQEDASFTSSSQQLNLITTELQEGVMKTRMQPIKNVWNKFPRVVRDVAVACSKEARVEMEGADTELDKTIIEAIKDPLTHLVRNAVDHGIEAPGERAACGKPAEGCLLLRAFHEGGQVNIEIIDDGAGIDPKYIKEKALEGGLVPPSDLAGMSDREILNMIFMPGFSTADQVSNISGRGVGMDVVKTNIEKIGGTVDVHSQQGKGTTFKIKIPLTLAIIPALVVRTGGDRFAIPQVNLLELVRLEGEQVQEDIDQINNTPIYRLRGKLLPLIYLGEILGLEDRSSEARQDREAISIVVLQAEDQNFGLVVDEVIDTEEVVVKPLSKLIKDLSAYAGATIMGDGQVALILDVLGLADRAGVLSEEATAQRGADAQSQEERQDEQGKQMLLLLRVGRRRLAVPRAVVSRLEEIPFEQVEQVGHREMVQYRGNLLPLIRLSRALGDVPEMPEEEPSSLQVVVCTLDGLSVGLVVDEITDVVEEKIELKHLDSTNGIAGLAVLQERITEVLDVQELVHAAGLIRAEEDETFTVAA